MVIFKYLDYHLFSYKLKITFKNEKICVFSKVKQNLVDINSKINQTNWKPDIILSINRGGCVPGVFLSHMRDLNHEVLSFKNIININNDIIKKS